MCGIISLLTAFIFLCAPALAHFWDAHDNAARGVSMGTTLVAAKFDGGVVLGADSRTSSGAYVAHRFAEKMDQVHRSIVLCRSGSAADTQFVAETVAVRLEGYELTCDRAPSVRTAATLVKNLCYQHRDTFSASIVCAGWDPRKGASIYIIPPGGALLEQEYALSGSGSAYITGYCDEHFDRRSGAGSNDGGGTGSGDGRSRGDSGSSGGDGGSSALSREECIERVRHAVELAIARDTASGGVVRLCIVDRNGVERRVIVPRDWPSTLKYK
ncbi:unnamed protein product [Phaeothamnion confervicola]